MQDRVAKPTVSRSHRVEAARSDTRWLLAWIGVFAGSMLLIVVAHQVYRLTGPHPQVTAFIRQLKHHSRWLIPGMKGKRASIFLLPMPRLPIEPH
jgi:hypothetical protein